ncbi:hypothetical protein AB0A71_19930 [Kitasatospora aureofaciens]|uniref:hypothetical protein n=1 Tax=Kitasatospora aureofaciens TaxID=1894 RepID=UPI00340B3659
MTTIPAPGANPAPRRTRAPAVRWPGSVRRPGSADFERSAAEWLFDLAPARWSYEQVFHRNPLDLALMVRFHLDAEILAMQAGLKALRIALIGAPQHPDDAETIDACLREQAWARAVRGQVRLVEDALHLSAGRVGRKRVASLTVNVP